MKKLFALITATILVGFIFLVYDYNSNKIHVGIETGESRKIIHSFLKDQFQPYHKSGITKDMMEYIDTMPEDVRKHFSIARFQIINNTVYGEYDGFYNKAFRRLTAAIYSTLKTHTIANIDFAVLMGDGMPDNPPGSKEDYRSKLEQFPIFFFSKDIKQKNFPLMPDLYMIDLKWAKLMKSIIETSNNISWSQKEEVIFWRGAGTGGSYNLENTQALPRLTLVTLSQNNPGIVNAKFAGVIQYSKDKSGEALKQKITSLDLKDDKVKEEDHLKYKYLISIDGNTSAWQRVPWILLSNSVLLKQETTNIQWFYPALKSYTHYVPIKEDLSDLMEKFNWLKEHDDLAKQISDNGTKFALANLTPEHIEEDIAIVLNAYAENQRFTLDKPSMPKLNRTLNVAIAHVLEWLRIIKEYIPFMN